nr:hypothetical protein [Tanacetum cinerariifolium]
MLNKENYVPWSSRLLRYAKSRPNGKLIHNFIINGPYTDDELTEKELKQIEADDQAIQTILLGLPKDIYAAVDSCETAQKTWLRNYMQQPMLNLEDITDPTIAINMTLALMAKAFKLNYSTLTNNNQRISSNPRNRQIAQPVQNPRIQNVGNQNGLLGVPGNANKNPNGNGSLVAVRAKGNATGHNRNQITCYNCRRVGHFARNYTVRQRRRDAAYLQTQLLIAQKEEAGIQLQAEEFDMMAAAADLDEIKETDQLSVEQSGGTVEQHPANVEEKHVLYDSLYNDLAIEVEKVNTKSVYQEQCLSKKINALHLSFSKQIMTLNEEISDLNKQLSTEKSTVSSLLEEKKKLKSDFKICKDELLDKQIQLEKRIKELDNILVKTGQSIQTIHMLSPKPDSFYHTKQKMALGYQNPFYLKQAQQKQQTLYDGKVLLEKHDPPVVHDSEEALQLSQESHLKMKQLNKEIKPGIYTQINHLSGVKSTIVTLQCVFKQRMTLDTHNWSSSAHQELHKIVKDEIFPIVNQVDVRVQNFEIQFLKEAAKFVGDFKSLAKEADESLAKHKALELEIERLLRAFVSQDILSVVQNNSVDETSNLQTEIERTNERFENCIIKKENEYAKLWNYWYKKCEECKFDKISYDKAYNGMQQKFERLQSQLGDLKGKSKDTSFVSDTLNPLS